METIFEAARVTAQQAVAAYPLVAIAHPDIDFDGWAGHLRRYEGQTGQGIGLIALYDRRRHIHGIFAYEVVQSLSGEARLNVSELACARLPGAALIDALLRFADHLAAELKLSTIALELESGALPGREQATMEQRGFALERVRMLRRAR